MSKKELLDPIGSLCRLISIGFYPKNTKIRITNHIIELDVPNVAQGFFRMCSGDGRENISEIYDVIVRLIKWFILKPSEEQKLEPEPIFLFDDEDSDEEQSNKSSSSSTTSTSNSSYQSICGSEEIKKMIKYLCISLRKLQVLTYNEGNVILAIQFYINILNDSLNNIFNDPLPKNIDCDETLLDYEKLKKLWTLDDIKYICARYDECFAILDNENYKEDEIGKNKIIHGIISYIDTKLNIKNAEFQKLIKNSNR